MYASTPTARISVNGQVVETPCLTLQNRTIVTTGKWLKTARIHDEDFISGAILKEPESFLTQLRGQNLRADIFTFTQSLSESEPKYGYPRVTDNAAVVKLGTYTEWWEGLPQEARKNARRAAKRGVTVRRVEFNDELVAGIKEIYDETPIRQGRQFWHYGKPLDAVRRENGTFLNESEFIAAYCGTELIGFIKMVFVDDAARIMQIISKESHFDKRPANAMIPQAVERCAERGMKFFVYGKYTYGNKKNSPITEFKRRNGFVELTFPRYYVPLTARGRAAVALNLHLGLKNLLPERLTNFLLATRAKVYQRTLAKKAQPAAKPAGVGAGEDV